MADRRSAEGVEHLQAAARELLGAARAFLDVVEEVVEDPERLSGAASAVSDLVRNGLGVTRREPWEEAAWDAGDPGDPEDAGAADGRDEPEQPAPRPAAKSSERATSRVRRISVD